jgi:predicted ATPase
MINPRLAEALSDRYRLERELGSGGMATVYLATDLRHERQVAVKVLHPELSAALGAGRFQREITTTANLRHPNILPLFDSGEGAGYLYYVMPVIEGESLRTRLGREGSLSLDEALRITAQVADALDHAHARGVVHRDIKPENILLEDGHAIVADFGIAHAVRGGGEDRLTRVGTTLGTPQYMSPEQAAGDPVDARSDLYALGCVAWEMLAGAPPFSGPTPMAILVRHAVDPVPRLASVCPDLPDHITAAIERALAKAPGDRFATLREWRDALVAPTTTGPTVAASTIDKPPPAPPTSLLGRDGEVAAAVERLRAGVRVLTITGPGGTGKTRFAVELYTLVRDRYPDGAAFVSLASVTDAADVMPTVCIALDIAEAHGRSALDAVVTVVGNRRVLLLLDNLEQVLGAAGDIAILVARCPRLQVLATSRSPLKIGAEVEVALPPLGLPAPDDTSVEALLRCPSVELFVQRAERVKPGFTLGTTNAAAVSRICRRLDGLPLALELAAARVRILEPAALLRRLDHALDLLTSGDRDLPLRQRTLRATVSWSYSLLEVGEQRLLRHLSVFHEGWTLEAMERVCYEDRERHRALDDLHSLVEKGLVRVEGGGERYSLLETIRAFAAEQLHAGGEVTEARDAHAAWFLEFAGAVNAGITGHGQVEAMARARADNANTLAALNWLRSQAHAGDLDGLECGLLLSGMLGWYWHIAGLHLVAEEAVDALVGLARDRPPSRGRAAAMFTGGMVSANTGDMEQALAEWTGMLADARAVGDNTLATFGQGGIGYASLGLGRIAEAREALERSVELAEADHHPYHIGLMRTILGMCLFAAGNLEAGIAMVESARPHQIRIGDYEGGGLALSFLAQMRFAGGEHERSLALYHEALTAFETVGDKPELARVKGELGWVAIATGDLPEARRWFRRSLRAYDEVGSPRGTGQALMGLAVTEARADNVERALTIAAAAQVLSERTGVVVEHPMAPGLTAQIEALKASVPREALDALVASGSGLSPAEVLVMVAANE